jgi:hypothetical protein
MSAVESHSDTVSPAQIPRMDLVRTVVIGDVELRYRAVSMSDFDIEAVFDVEEQTSLHLDPAIRETDGFGPAAPADPSAPNGARLDVTHWTGDHHAR